MLCPEFVRDAKMQQMSTEQHPDVAIVMSTFPSTETAEAAIRSLVEDGCIACGTLLPGAVSIYRWNGATERSVEVQTLLKVRASAVQEVVDRLAALHPYDVPEIVSLQVSGGFAPYLQWVCGT